MSRTAADRFSEFLERLTPKYSEPEAVEINLATIERCLSEAFDLQYAAPYGSTGHGANIAGESARVISAVMSKNSLLEDSLLSLERVKKVLDEAFPHASMTEGRPVIAVPFGQSRTERHHVVPAFLIGSRGEFDTFGIPGPSSRWIEACPGGHSAWINRVDVELGHRLKPFIRIA